MAAAISVAAIVVILSTNAKKEDEGIPEAAELTLEDFLHGKFASKSFNGTWVSGKVDL